MRGYAITASALMLAVTLGCAGSDRPERPDLRAVPQPDSSQMSDAVRAQVRQRYANLSTKLGNRSTPSSELATAYGEVGELLLAARYLETAEPALLNARLLAPKDPRWPYYIAHLYRIRGALDEAAVFFQEALERGADSLATLTWLASVQVDLGRYDAAEPLLESALRRDPASAATHYQYGRLRLARRDFAGAAQHLETALKEDSRGAAIRYPLAMAYRGLGRQADADEQLRGRDQSNSEISPPDPLMDRLAELLEGPQAYTVRGTEALNRGEWAKAAEEFRKGLTLAPHSPLLRHRLAIALFMMGSVDEAQHAFEDVIRSSPDYSPAHYSLGLLFEGRGRESEALDEYAAAVKYAPSYVQPRLRLAALRRRSGRAEQALAEYEQILRVDPRLDEAHLEMAITLVRLRRYADARDLLVADMKAFPQQPGFARALARLLAAAPDDRVRDGVRAVALTQKLLQTDQSTDVGETMAMALAETGQYEEAVRIQRELIGVARGAGQRELVAHLEENLKLYEQRKPCRTPWRDQDVGDVAAAPTDLRAALPQ